MHDVTLKKVTGTFQPFSKRAWGLASLPSSPPGVLHARFNLYAELDETTWGPETARLVLNNHQLLLHIPTYIIYSGTF